MALLDANEKPIQSAQAKEEAKNGHDHDSGKGKADVRTIPTGTLIYNLIRFTGEEIGMENVVHELEQVKLQQKMVADPPQLAPIRQHLAQLKEFRFVVANEINERFLTVDKMRLAQCGIEVVEPSPSSEATTVVEGTEA